MKWKFVLYISNSHLLLFLILFHYGTCIHFESFYLMYNHSRSLMNNNNNNNYNKSESTNTNSTTIFEDKLNSKFLTHKMKQVVIKENLNATNKLDNLTLTEYIKHGIRLDVKKEQPKQLNTAKSDNEKFLYRLMNTGLSLVTIGLIMSVFVGLIIVMYSKIRNSDKINN